MAVKKFKTVEEIRAAFIKKGWSEDTDFTMISAEDVKKAYGLVNCKEEYLFKMKGTGNIYNNKGKIYLYNL